MVDFALRQKIERMLVEFCEREGGSVYDACLEETGGSIDLLLLADDLMDRFDIKERS